MQCQFTDKYLLQQKAFWDEPGHLMPDWQLTERRKKQKRIQEGMKTMSHIKVFHRWKHRDVAFGPTRRQATGQKAPLVRNRLQREQQLHVNIRGSEFGEKVFLKS